MPKSHIYFFDQAQIELGFPGFHDTTIDGFGSVSLAPPPKARARAGSASSSAKAWWEASGSCSTTRPCPPRISGKGSVGQTTTGKLAAIAVAKLMIPETNKAETAGKQVELPREDTLNGLDVAACGAVQGVHLVLNVLAMLIAFVGLVALANYGKARPTD